MERKLRGFTFIELIVVIAILAVLSAIGVPTALNWVRDAKVRNANEKARLVYSAVQDYLTELEIKNIDLKDPGSPDEMIMYSCSTEASLPEPVVNSIRADIAEYGCFYSGAMVNGCLKDVAIDLSASLGEDFEGVWAAKINLNTYTVIETYWSQYLEGSDPATPPVQTDVTNAASFTNGADQETYYSQHGAAIGKYPM